MRDCSLMWENIESSRNVNLYELFDDLVIVCN